MGDSGYRGPRHSRIILTGLSEMRHLIETHIQLQKAELEKSVFPTWPVLSCS